jgi:hypothetical protein
MNLGAPELAIILAIVAVPAAIVAVVVLLAVSRRDRR